MVKIGQYLAKIKTKCNSLLFFGPPCTVPWPSLHMSESDVLIASLRYGVYRAIALFAPSSPRLIIHSHNA